MKDLPGYYSAEERALVVVAAHEDGGGEIERERALRRKTGDILSYPTNHLNKVSYPYQTNN